jgi:hypothetical protein
MVTNLNGGSECFHFSLFGQILERHFFADQTRLFFFEDVPVFFGEALLLVFVNARGVYEFKSPLETLRQNKVDAAKFAALPGLRAVGHQLDDLPPCAC